MTKAWKPLSQATLRAHHPDASGYITIIADASGNSYSGRLISCGSASLVLGRPNGDEHIHFLNRSYQFYILPPPPHRTFKVMEHDLFTLQNPKKPEGDAKTHLSPPSTDSED